MGEASDDQVFLPLALIDAVALVEDGAEWTMFATQFAENGLPMFEVIIATLRDNGWVIDSHGASHSLTPPSSASASTEPSPSGYSLSRIWEGGNCWQASFGEVCEAWSITSGARLGTTRSTQGRRWRRRVRGDGCSRT